MSRLRRIFGLGLILSGGTALGAPVPGSDLLYTRDSDFDWGAFLSVNHNTPNNDQLQLDHPPSPFPFVNIAASGRGTIMRINVNTGEVLGEYQTAPDGMGRDPSRTTVDQQGNVWVANRAEWGNCDGVAKGSVARVGLVLGGTRVDASGTPNPAGQYLQPPFLYNTCVDRNRDGLIRTSSGLGVVLPWTNAGYADSCGGVSTADDECIINYTRVAGTGTRTVAVDADNDVWVGGLGNFAHEKLSGVTGLPVPGTQFNLYCGGYGGLIDRNGVLWSSTDGYSQLLRFDPKTMTGTCLGGFSYGYGLGADPLTNEIWHTLLYNYQVCKIDPSGSPYDCFTHGTYYAQGVTVDGKGNVWVAGSILGGGSTVDHLRTDGTFVGSVPVGSGPTGVAVDANGKIWVANYYSSTAMRIDPDAGPIGGGGFPVGAVDLTVDLGPGAYPYNYSDMTGFVAIGVTSPQGSWTVVQDGGLAGMEWGRVTWNTEPQGSVPPGTGISAAVRAADNEADLSSQTFVPVENGQAFSMFGRFIEVQATLKASAAGISPVLSDVRIQIPNQPPVAKCLDVTVSAGPACTADASIDAGSYDPDQDPITVVQSPLPPYGKGPTPVTLTVTDSQNQSATCTGTVTVLDETAPVLTCPAPQILECTGPQGTLAVFENATAHDNCDSVTASCSPPSGSVFPPGTTPVACSASDSSGNTGTCGFDIQVRDTTPPAVSCAVATPGLWLPMPPNHDLVNVGYSASATDICGGSLGVTTKVFGNEDDEMDTGDGVFSPDARDVAPGTLRLRDERKGSGKGRVYLIVASAADPSGNSAVACCTVVVPRDASSASAKAANALAASAKSYCLANQGAMPPNYFVVGDGAVIGPKQ